MKTKSIKIRLLVILALCAMLVMASAVMSKAFAEEIPETEQAETVDTDTDEDKSIVDVFNDTVKPILINVATNAGLFVVALIPLLKTIGSRNSFRSAYNVVKKEAVEYKEMANDLMKKLADVDYRAIVKETIGVDLDAFKETIKGEIIRLVGGMNSHIAENTVEAKLQAERLDKLLTAALPAWGDIEGVAEILASAPSSTVLKREALRNQKYKEIINHLKGEEAEDIIAAADAEIEEGV